MSQHPHPRRRPRGTPAAAASLLGAALTFGCTGTIEQTAPRAGRGDEGGAGGAGRPASTRDAGAKPAGPAGLPGAGACRAAPLPPARVVRLTPVQIVNTLRGTFGATAVSTSMLPFDGVTEGFDTNARANYVSDRFAAALREIGKGVAAAQAPALLQANPCLQAAPLTNECAGAFVAALGERAFRRPLDADERERFGALVKAEAGARGAAAGVAATLEAMLQSPRFLYRTELGAGGAGADETRVPLTPFEVASSLSFLVTDAPPDAPLMQAARDGKLGDRSVVAAQAKRLLKTPQAREKLKTFFSQLLGIGELAAAAIPKDTTLVPTWTESLRQDLVAETLTLVDRAFASEGKPLVELFTAPYSYLNPRLIKHYGLPPAADTSNTLKKMDVPPQMAGLLSRGALMARLAHESTTSPVHRGVFVREALLCSPPPLPPPGASNQTDLLNGTTADATQRERYAAFRKNAPGVCADCHELFQPLGLAFERFDAAGRPRDAEFGKPIDTAGTLVGAGDADGPFADGVELAGKIARSRAGQACFASQYARFALGFGRGEVDDCHVEEEAAAFREGALTAEALLVALTQTDAFYFRSRRGGKAP